MTGADGKPAMTPEQMHALITAEPAVDEAVRFAVECYVTTTLWAEEHADLRKSDALTLELARVVRERRGVLEAWLTT